jgi:hypothetical protein
VALLDGDSVGGLQREAAAVPVSRHGGVLARLRIDEADDPRRGSGRDDGEVDPEERRDAGELRGDREERKPRVDEEMQTRASVCESCA